MIVPAESVILKRARKNDTERKEKSKITKQQSISSKKPKSQEPRVPQPLAPLSPMVYPKVYSPLSR